jgi:hypothetical protein
MKQEFEYMSYGEADRIAMLENRAAELERRLLAVTPPGGFPEWGNVAVPDPGSHRSSAVDSAGLDSAGLDSAGLDSAGLDSAGLDSAGLGDADVIEPGDPDSSSADAPDGRTEALINHGRRGHRRSRTAWARAHWRLLAVGGAALLIGMITALIVAGGGGGSWPASVAQVKSEVMQACENQDVAAEPSGLNFACGKNTQAVLWVFSLLTSGDNPGFVDQSTGRKGLEPIAAAQGGNIAWSLNLHHPYNPASPVDSLEVAARAINNIISGATLTNASGAAVVEPGLESKPASCQRYTGSPQVISKQGYPVRCASAVTSPAGQAALVSDVFKQWMGGAQSQLANEAGTLFENADSPQVQAILATLPAGS